MIKRMISVLLAVMMVISVMAVGIVTARATDYSGLTLDSGKLYFDANSTGWDMIDSKIAFYAFPLSDDVGAAYRGWGGRRLQGTDADKDGIWEFAPTQWKLEDGTQYKIIFAKADKSNAWVAQTYDLYFDTTCLGHIAYCNGTVYENPADSSKTALAAVFYGKDPASYGPVLQVSSIGNVVGSCIEQGKTPYDIFVDFISVVNAETGTTVLDNARKYVVTPGTKTEQKMIDDIGTGLCLTKDDVAKAFSEKEVETTWTAADSTLPASGAPHTHIPGTPVIENDTTSCLKSGTYDEVIYCFACGAELSRETKSADPLGHHLVFVKQVSPTYSSNGRYAHYECDRCGKLFADVTGTHEITEDILVIPMLVKETWAPEPTEPETEPPTEPDPIESVYGDFAYKLYSDGHIEITKYNGNDTTVSVPSEIDGHPVTLIGEKAFYGNTALTEVTIPNSVKFIGSNAFSHCSALETVSLPDSIKYLNYGLFSYCTSLKNVMIPASVTNIGYNAFYHCFSLTDITIPESVTSINSQAFDWCPSLKQVNIPQSVKSIGSKTFGYVCDQKTDGFKILGYENSAAHKYARVNGFNFESTGYIFVPPTEPKPTSPYPEPTEAPTEPATEPTPGQIGDKTYNLNTNNKTATLQKYSGYSANVSIPSQEYIHHYYYSDSGYYNITAIGNAAFAGNSYVKSVTIPNTVTTIGDDAFFRCSSLSNVTIPDSVTSIGSWALAQCDNLKSVTIPSSVTSIGDKAFGYIDANTKVDGFTITGRTGSAAYKYAVKNGFEFVANDSNISGDVDSDYEVTIMDATAIQAYLAYQRSLNGGEYEPVEIGSRDFTVADVDGDGRISIFDSLRIQRYCAKMCKLDGSPYDA